MRSNSASRFARRSIFLTACVLGIVQPALIGPSAAAVTAETVRVAETTEVWSWPVSLPRHVVAPFEAPPTPYSAGHRGLDLANPADGFVRAPADGVVHFVGYVVDRPVVTLAITDDRLASFEPVIGLVALGESVARGQVIGQVGSGGHCDAVCVHFGVRLRGDYVSPLLYLGGVPRAVLLPLD